MTKKTVLKYLKAGLDSIDLLRFVVRVGDFDNFDLGVNFTKIL
jgi:hypothetical protein